MAKVKEKKTKDTSGSGPIARSNRFYVQLKGYGHCDDNERTVMGLGTTGKKLVAEPDQPLFTLIRPVINHWMKAMDWSTTEAAQSDLAKFQKWIASLSCRTEG